MREVFLMINKLRQSNWLDWPIVLMALLIFSQPFGVSFELFTLIMAVLGIRSLVKNEQAFRHSGAVKAYTTLFACFWIPMLMSLPDAYMLKKGVIDALGMLRFYFAGIFVIYSLSSIKIHERIAHVIACIVIFWILDAWVQFVTGSDLFGVSVYSASRVTGLFGDDPILGWMLVVYIGICAVAVYQSIGKWGLFIAVPVLVATVFISGNRGAWVAIVWIVIFLSMIAILWKVKVSKKVMLSSLLIIGVAITGLSTNDGLKSRLAHTFQGVGSADFESWDKATAYRLTLWNTAIKMISDKWINGVGFKGFRYAYPDYAEPDDKYVQGSVEGEPKTGAFHGHQIVIDAMAEMGVFGLLGLLAACWLVFWRYFWHVVKLRQLIPLGYYCGLVGVLFPVNTHLSLYKAYWAQAFWLLAALFVASLFTYARAMGDDKESSSPLDVS